MTALLLMLLAQSVAADNEKAHVEGAVTSSTTGAPLKKAVITLEGDKMNFHATTGEDGKFVFDNLSPGDYTLTPARVGYLETREKPVSLQNGDRKTIALKLTPQGIIAGHVVDEDGDPVTGVIVGIERIFVAGEKRIQSGFSEGDPVNGEAGFIFTGLIPGDYLLTAQPQQSAVVRAPRHWPDDPANPLIDKFVTTWFPGVTDQASASVVHVAPGGELRSLEIRMAKGASYRVSGKIPADLRGVAETLQLFSVSGAVWFTAQVAKGVFEFVNVPPGSYILHWSSFMATAFVRQPVEVGDRDVDDVEVTAMPPNELTGIFHFDGLSRPQQGILTLQPHLFSVNGLKIQPNADAEGAFRITVAPDKFDLVFADLPAGVYVKSVRYGGQNVGRVLDLTAGADAPLEITLAPNAAEISGTLRDDQDEPVPYWSVRLWRGAEVAESAQTASDGSFSFKNLAPGNYHLAAWDDADAPFDADFFQLFEAQSAAVTVHESSHENVDVKLIPVK